jgi:hypothetical protein
LDIPKRIAILLWNVQRTCGESVVRLSGGAIQDKPNASTTRTILLAAARGSVIETSLP